MLRLHLLLSSGTTCKGAKWDGAKEEDVMDQADDTGNGYLRKRQNRSQNDKTGYGEVAHKDWFLESKIPDKDAMLVDRESLDAITLGGLEKNGVKCTMFANGDIVSDTFSNELIEAEVADKAFQGKPPVILNNELIKLKVADKAF
ncbi:hypothetical protein Tco_0881908 [Tanacetum coccineum]